MNAEHAIIGCILIQPSLAKECLLEPSDFIELGSLYQTLQELEFIDLTTVLSKAPAFTETVLECSRIGTSAGFNHYVKLVKRESQRRQLSMLGHSLLHIDDVDIDELLETTAKRLDEINVVLETKPYQHVSDGLAKIATELVNPKNRESMIPTYLSTIDRNLGGIERGDYWVIAGRPGMGKTAMALSMAYQQAKNGYGVGIVTMDMTATKLKRRLLCHERDAHLDALIKDKAGEYDYTKITKGAQVLSELPIYIADMGKLTTRDLERRVRMMVKKDNIQVVYIDYLQQIQAVGGTREQEVGSASATLKAIAKDMNVSVIALAQLNRALEVRPYHEDIFKNGKVPRMSDLRESGRIEQDTEVILFPYRDEVYNPSSDHSGTVHIFYGKTRDSAAATNFSKVKFFKESMRFADLYEEG
jgi:replicative DNA helicase